MNHLKKCTWLNSLTLALGFAVWLILVFGAGLATYLNHVNFHRAHGELVQSRIRVLAKDLQQQIVASMDLGLRLEQIQYLPALLEQTVLEDDDIVAVGIHDPSGIRLIDTEKETSKNVPVNWIASRLIKDGRHLTESGYYLFGMPLYNSFNVHVGTLTLRYDRMVDQPVDAMALVLWRNFFLIIMGFAVLITLGLTLLKRGMLLHLKVVTHRLETGQSQPDLESASALGRQLEKLADCCRTTELRLHQLVDEQAGMPLCSVRDVRGVLETGDVYPDPDRSAFSDSSCSKNFDDAEDKEAHRELNRWTRFSMALGLLMVLLATTTVTVCAWLEFRERFEPRLHQKIETLGRFLADELAKLHLQGVPLDRLKGVDAYFEQLRADNPELSYVALVDGQGMVLHSDGTLPIAAQLRFRDMSATIASSGTMVLGEPEIPKVVEKFFDHVIPVEIGEAGILAHLHFGQDRRFVDRLVQEIWWDIGTVLLVILLITGELLLFVTTKLIRAPMSAIHTLSCQVRNGDFFSRLVVHRNDEIGRLSSAINVSLDRANALFLKLGQTTSSKLDLHESLNTLASRSRFCGSEQAVPVAQDQLAIIRWPFFLFIFAESLSLSFFPLYVRHLYTPVSWLPESLVIGLPISLFMLVWALSLPPAGNWSDKVGRRRAFLTGAAVASAGLMMTAFAQGILDLMLWRSLTALGYGLVFITVQGYVVDHSLPTERARGMAMFLAVFFGGSLCGAAIGGILAERIGFAPIFLISAGLGFVAAVFVSCFLNGLPSDKQHKVSALRPGHVLTLARNHRFLAMTLLNAIPAKMALTGFLFFAMPLYLKSLALSPGDVGRVMMSYGLSMILLSPLVGFLADVWGRRQYFVLMGGGLAALAILLITWQPGPIASVLSILLLGAAHAIGISPQLALVMEWSKEEIEQIGPGTVMGIFRLLERIGNVMGPIVIALLISSLGFSLAFTVFGVYLLISVVLFAIVLWLSMRGKLSAKIKER